MSKYFDNAANTEPLGAVKQAMIKAMTAGNVSSSCPLNKKNRKLLAKFKHLAKSQNDQPEMYETIICRSASEANTLLISGIIRHMNAISNYMPHVITDNIEHGSIHACLKYYERLGQVSVTRVEVEKDSSLPTFGMPDEAKIIAAIRVTTVLITLMHVNNETGIISNLRNLPAAILTKSLERGRGPPVLHVDAVQSFSHKLYNGINADAHTISLHKFHGPIGVAALVVNKRLLEILDTPVVFGAQEKGLVGGTYNIPAIAGANVAMQQHDVHADELRNLMRLFLQELKKVMPVITLQNFNSGERSKEKCCVLLRNNRSPVKPGHLLISFYPNICAIKMQNALAEKGLWVGLGSACNGGGPSRILAALNIPRELQSATLRITFSQFNTRGDIIDLVRAIHTVLGR